jgi:hypothetical protein
MAPLIIVSNGMRHSASAESIAGAPAKTPAQLTSASRLSHLRPSSVSNASIDGKAL